MKPNIVRFYFIRDTGSESWPCFNAAIDVVKVQFWGKLFFFFIQQPFPHSYVLLKHNVHR